MVSRPKIIVNTKIEYLHAYDKITKDMVGKYPEYLGVVSSFLGWTREYASFTKMRQSFSRMTSFFLKSKRLDIEFTKCDVIIFYHHFRTPKTWPYVKYLAEALATQGKSCALISSKKCEYIYPDADGKIKWSEEEGFRHHINHGFSYFQATSVILRALKATMLLSWTSCVKDKRVFTNIFYDLPGLWYRLAISSHHFQLAKSMLKGINPKLIITDNLFKALGGEIVRSKEAQDVYKVVINHDMPQCRLSEYDVDEVWVWNEIRADELKDTLIIKNMPIMNKVPIIKIIGNGEVDGSLKCSGSIYEAGGVNKSFRAKAEGKKVFLFMSEYGGEGNHYAYNIRTRVALKWISKVADLFPDWLFIYKPRPDMSNKTGVPGKEFMVGKNNFIIAPVEIPYSEFLSWDNLGIVASICSSSMYVARGVGLMALRFVMPEKINWDCRAILNDVTTPVESPEEIAHNIAMLEKRGDNLRDTPDEKYYPYRGKCLKRATGLCLDILNQREMLRFN